MCGASYRELSLRKLICYKDRSTLYAFPDSEKVLFELLEVTDKLSQTDLFGKQL